MQLTPTESSQNFKACSKARVLTHGPQNLLKFHKMQILVTGSFWDKNGLHSKESGSQEALLSRCSSQVTPPAPPFPVRPCAGCYELGTADTE